MSETVLKKHRVMILLSPTSSGSIGSMTKCIGIAKAVEERNCQVCFAISGELGDTLRKLGYLVYPYPIPQPKKIMQDINNLTDFVEWAGMADESFIREAVKSEIEAIKQFKPDVIFAEARPSAIISARIAGVPTVMIASWPCSEKNIVNKKADGECIKGFNKVLKENNLPQINNVAELFFKDADIKLSPSIPELEPELSNEKDVIFAGYILDTDCSVKLPDWYTLWGKRDFQVFMYLSVSALPPSYYIDTVVNAFKDKPCRVVCSCGFHYEVSDLPHADDNIRFTRYIPSAPVMRDSDIVIFHGGQDTMLTALLNGLPSMTITGRHFERAYNAEQLEKIGASKRLSLMSFRANRLFSEVEEVLRGPYGDVSRRISHDLKNYGGTEYCAEVLAGMAGAS